MLKRDNNFQLQQRQHQQDTIAIEMQAEHQPTDYQLNNSVGSPRMMVSCQERTPPAVFTRTDIDGSTIDMQ